MGSQRLEQQDQDPGADRMPQVEVRAAGIDAQPEPPGSSGNLDLSEAGRLQCASASHRDGPGAGQRRWQNAVAKGTTEPGQVPAGISIQEMAMAVPLKATTTKGQLLSRSSSRCCSLVRTGPSSSASISA